MVSRLCCLGRLVTADHGQAEAGAGQLRDLLRELMELTVDELGDRDNLTEAVDAVLPWDPSERVLEHAFDGDFTLLEMDDADAAQYLCDAETSPTDSYYASLFRFKTPRSGVLGLLWRREGGAFRIVSYEAYEQ